MRYRLHILLLILFCFSIHTAAQDSVSYKGKKGYSKVSRAAEELKKSLDSDDEEQTARQYENLARELFTKGDNAKAEEYLKKAQALYSKLGNKRKLASVSRDLAKLQESQHKIAPAIKNYDVAANTSKDKVSYTTNTNDANRLRNSYDPELQSKYAQSNAELFEKQGKKEEAIDAYKQLAESQLQQNNTGDALTSYKKAIQAADNPEEAASLSQEMAKIYAADDQIDKAIAVSKEALNKAKTTKNTELQIDQLKDLAQLYARTNQTVQTGALLKEAYQLALKSGNTLKAKACLEALVQYYKEQGEERKALTEYGDFMNRLDSLIRTDSSLIDARYFELTESRIKELEKERQLQNELITKKNRFNYVLIGSIGAMLLLLLVIARSLYAIKVKNKKIALQSLRREMNPHFIFNSLNSVNQYIAQNNELEANKYLTSYSGLMRNIMENSNKDFVSLSMEAEQLKKYLNLEHLRFHDKFDYTLHIDEALDPDATIVPNMLIQPHLENAIWHGLRYKETKGKLEVSFLKKAGAIEVRIKDDGIGLSKSHALKTMNQKSHASRGLTNTSERISLLNDLYKTDIRMKLEELQGEEGTLVTLHIPIIPKK
jgi:tetratricopeptide (TPR) repeat protein